MTSLFLTLGCTPEPVAVAEPGTLKQTGDTIMLVNEQAITQTMVDTMMQSLPPEQLAQIEKDPNAFENIKEQLVIGEVLYRKALAEKTYEKESVQTAIAVATRQVLANELLKSVGDAAGTDEALREWYDSKKVQFSRQSVHGWHILVKEQDLANNISNKIKAGADFAAMANEYSIDKESGAQGGDLSWIEKGRIIPALDAVLFSITLNEVSEPIQTDYGYHIVKVSEKRDVTPFEDVKDQAKGAVGQEAVESYVEEIKSSATVEVIKNPFATEEEAK